MSDTIIFVIGSGVFAVTTTATLLWGYSWFTDKAIEAGVDVGEGFANDPDDEEAESKAGRSVIPIDMARIYRQLPLTPTR